MAYIWKISIVEFKNKSFVDGIVLEGSPPTHRQRMGILRNTPGVIGSYFRKPYSEKKITLVLGSKQVDIFTDERGSFNLELDHKIDPDFRIIAEDQPQPLSLIQSYPVFFTKSDYPINIISDIDDTLLVSHTANAWHRIKTILFISPKNRKPVDFTRDLLETVWNNDGRIFYVSKSESNLFRLLASSIQSLNLPQGNLTLTPYLRYNQLLKPKKGKDFKERSIREILDNTPDKQYILMGDDTQRDMAVYTRIAELYPHRILKIYIRKTKKNLMGNKKVLMNNLMNSAVPTLYFSDDTDPGKEITLLENHQNT